MKMGFCASVFTLLLHLYFVSNQIVVINAAFQSLYTFRAEDCAIRNAFQEDSPASARLMLGPYRGVRASCLDGQGVTEGFPAASNGISLERSGSEIVSSWNVSDILDNGFNGDMFTIAIWYSLAANVSERDQTLFQIGEQLRLTPVGAKVLVGRSISTGVDNVLPFSTDSGAKMLMVFTAGAKRGRLYRRSWNTSAPGVEGDFDFPEVFMSVTVPRMSTWPSASTSRIAFSGKLYSIRFYEGASITADSIYRQGPPDWKPRCPSIIDSRHYATEHTDSMSINLASSTHIGSTFKTGIKYRIESLPRFGRLLGDDGSPIRNLPAFAKRLTYRENNGDITKNDTFSVRAVLETDETCLSAYAATASIEVVPVNDPPVPGNIRLQAGAGKGTLIRLGGADPDNDVHEMRGGNSRVLVQWSPVTLGGRLYPGPCLASQQFLPASLNGTAYETANGTGWSALFCYYPDYSTDKFSRSSGMEIVGQETFFFKLYDEFGALSASVGTVTIDVLNPAFDGPSSVIVQQGIEETELKLNLTQTPFPVSQAWITSHPVSGTLFSPRGKPVVGKVQDLENLYFVPKIDFAGMDEFTFRVEDVSGYLSPPYTMQLQVRNAYDPSTLSVRNASVLVRSFQRTMLGLSMENRDYDAYRVQISVSMENDDAGLLSVNSLNSSVIVSSGSACIEVGCKEPLVFSGFPSIVDLALRHLEYVSVAALNNKMTVTVSDFQDGRWNQVDEAYVIVQSADKTVWGTDSAVRGSNVVGAAIAGTLIAFVLVFGRGLWVMMPAQTRVRLIAVVSSLRCFQGSKVNHKTRTINRAILRPPSYSAGRAKTDIQRSSADTIEKKHVSSSSLESTAYNGPAMDHSAVLDAVPREIPATGSSPPPAFFAAAIPPPLPPRPAQYAMNKPVQKQPEIVAEGRETSGRSHRESVVDEEWSTVGLV